MIGSLSPRDARTLSIGLACVLGILSVSRLIPWWSRTLQEKRDAAREIRNELLVATELVQGTRLSKDSVQQLGGQLLRAQTRLLTAGTVAAADAALAALLSRIAAEAGVQLDVVQPIGDTLRFGPFARVAVRTQLSSDIQGLMDMLQLIEGDTIMLAVTSLTITQSDVFADDNRPEALRGEIVMRALFRPSAMP